ncbi:MAG TPA: hypothetical protein VLB12_03740 [Gemmatimonadales bacterium]|nr:hypothetical protein [Gemmatimonadales bacterium]
MSEDSEILERAMRYPYAVPARPFVQRGHRTLDPAEVEIDRELRSRLLVYGSNASPEVLARKLALSGDPVLVEPAWLHDFDVVYSAHFSPYGAVPATLQRSPGTAVRVAVIHLTDEQLRLISATEPNYDLTSFDAASCELPNGAVTQLSAYISRHGCLLADGEEVALVAVPARERRFAELSEPQVLERLRKQLSPEETIDAFVLGGVTDPELAQARSAKLDRRAFSLAP